MCCQSLSMFRIECLRESGTRFCIACECLIAICCNRPPGTTQTSKSEIDIRTSTRRLGRTLHTWLSTLDSRPTPKMIYSTRTEPHDFKTDGRHADFPSMPGTKPGQLRCYFGELAWNRASLSFVNMPPMCSVLRPSGRSVDASASNFLVDICYVSRPQLAAP